MNAPIANRRRNRSSILQRALELQLEATAERSRFSSLVLVDELGLVVACAGDRERAVHLAALSPNLAAPDGVWQGEVDTGEQAVDVSVAPLSIDDTRLYLTACGGSRPEALKELSHAGRGVLRILG